MRGLKNFITECLDCRSKEEEKQRVTKELANIRKHFGAQNLNGYNRKKYVAKLLYIHLLGYTFDFGFPQMIELLASPVFSEKQIGYITLGVYLNGNYDLVTMIIEHLRKEIMTGDSEPAQCLALSAAANIGGTEIAETLAPTILNILKSQRCTDFVKKKAALALVRLYRETPSTFQFTDDTIRILTALLQDANFGVQLSGASLVLVLMTRYSNELQPIFPIAIQMLTKIFFEFTVPLDYTYGRNPVPWLVMKYMKILQYKVTWQTEEINKITRVLDICYQKTDLLLNTKEVHANMMLLFESINLVIATQLTSQYLARSAAILGGFLSAKQSNVRYLAIETLTRLVSASPEVIPSLDKHRQTLFLALRDADNSIRRRTLTLLYVLCTQESAEEIVQELLNYLKFADITMREPLCLKIAVLAESFMTDLAWYVDVILQLITLAGDECNDGVWHRVVQVISMNTQYQRYATLTSYNSMTSPLAHDRLVKLAAQLVGEYAHLIEVSPNEIISELQKKFHSSSEDAKAIILSALAKIGARYEPVRQTVVEFIQPLRNNQNIDIQQRSIEYCSILSGPPNVIAAVFKPIPPFKERKSSLVQQVLSDYNPIAPVVSDNDEEEQDQEGNDGALATSLPVRVPEPEHPQQQQPQQQSPPPQQPQQDLLGDLMSPSPQQQPPQQQQQPPQQNPFASQQRPQQPQQQPPQNDLDGLMNTPPGEDLLQALGGGSSTQTASYTSSQESIYKHFLTEDSGIVFDDPNIQVQLQIQVSRNNALLTFNIQNKTPGQITGVKINILPVPFFRSVARPGPNVINAGAAIQYQYAITVVQPYSTPPNYFVIYQQPADVKQQMKLPLVITKFMMPYPMDQNMFFARWGQFSSPNQTAKISYPIVPNVDPVQQMSQVMNRLLRIPVLNLQVPPLNVVGAGIIQCEGSPQGVLARFFADQNTNSVQVEIKGTSPHITDAIQHVLNSHFK